MTVKKKITLALTLLAAASIGGLYVQNSREPELGVSQGKLKPLGLRPNDVSSLSNIPTKYVSPLPFKATPEKTLLALKEAVFAYGGAEIKSETNDYLHVVFTTPVLRFRDDTEFYLDQTTQHVQVRSASRAGWSDTGLNRRRYQELARHYLQAE